MPDVSRLVENTDYDTKISATEKKLTYHNHDKYITTREFNKFATYVLDTQLPRGNFLTKANVDNKLKSSIKKLTQTRQNIYSLKINFKN